MIGREPVRLVKPQTDFGVCGTPADSIQSMRLASRELIAECRIRRHRAQQQRSHRICRRRLAAVLLLGIATGCGPESNLPKEIAILPGAVNGAAIERDGRAIAFYGDPVGEFQNVDKVFLTHHRRDAVWAALDLASGGARVVAPALELPYLAEAEGFWNEFQGTRFHDYAQQSTKVLTTNLDVQEPARGGRSIEWKGLTIDVLDTPGYTRGSVSYLVEIGGRRVAFTGDLLFRGGKILDLYSLQDSIEETETRGYHGYAARAADVISSLRRLSAAEPDIVVPARGPIIDDPARDIDLLLGRIQRLFRAYFRTDALRWYWGEENLAQRARRILGDTPVDWMPMAVRIRQTPPRWWHKFGTSRLLVSDSKAAFLIDCGSESAMAQISRLQQRRVFDRLEGIFVTHFHDDHTEFVQAMASEHDVPVYAGRELQDILQNPDAYRMPAMTFKPIRPVHSLAEGQKLRWHEFEFEYTYFPGQAIYHGGLDVRRDNGERYFFVGDSFSPSGLDDYCLLNRHLLHPSLGHFRCLEKLRGMEGDYWLVNQHIDEVFQYSDEQLVTMTEVLEEKKRAIAEMVPWEDPNFGVDEQWSRFYPYGLEASPAEEFDLYAVVLNHLPEAQTFRIRPNVPNGWKCSPRFAEFHVAARKEERVLFRVTPDEEASGLTVLTADVAFGEHDLRRWIETLVAVRP